MNFQNGIKILTLTFGCPSNKYDQGRTEGGTMPRAPNHCGSEEVLATLLGRFVARKQRRKYFLQHSTFAPECPQLRTWGALNLFLAPGVI